MLPVYERIKEKEKQLGWKGRAYSETLPRLKPSAKI